MSEIENNGENQEHEGDNNQTMSEIENNGENQEHEGDNNQTMSEIENNGENQLYVYNKSKSKHFEYYSFDCCIIICLDLCSIISNIHYKVRTRKFGDTDP